MTHKRSSDDLAMVRSCDVFNSCVVACYADATPPSSAGVVVTLSSDTNASSASSSTISASGSASMQSLPTAGAVAASQPRCVLVTTDRVLVLQWSGFHDNDYPLAVGRGEALSYTVSLGLSPNTTNLVAPVAVGATLTATLPFDRAFAGSHGGVSGSGTQVTGCVQATNAAGLTTLPNCVTTSLLLSPSTVMTC